MIWRWYYDDNPTVLTDTMYLLLGANATQLMPYLWPGNSATHDLSWGKRKRLGWRRKKVCKGRRIKGGEEQEEEAGDFVEAGEHYEGREGWVWNPSYEDYTMRMGIKRVRDDPRDIQENYRDASLVYRKRWDLDNGQRRPIRGEKKERSTRQKGDLEPEYPTPWQREGVHIRQWQDISHPLTWNKTKMLKGSNHHNTIAMKRHFITAHWILQWFHIHTEAE